MYSLMLSRALGNTKLCGIISRKKIVLVQNKSQLIFIYVF